MSRLANQIRSVRGQLWLLAGMFVVAIILAVAAACTRELIFERWARERRPEPPEGLRLLVGALATGRVSDWNADSPGLDVAYGVLIDEPEIDRNSLAARVLFAKDAEQMLGLVRRTLAAGDVAQRSAAVQLLAVAPLDKKAEVTALVERARERARRRHEPELIEVCDRTLHRLATGRPTARTHHPKEHDHG